VKFGLEPVGHVPPLRRISINDPIPAEAPASPTTWEICDNLMKQHEANRIWALIVDTAGGTNATVPVPAMQDQPDCRAEEGN
jgi:hypothetical protein